MFMHLALSKHQKIVHYCCCHCCCFIIVIVAIINYYLCAINYLTSFSFTMHLFTPTSHQDCSFPLGAIGQTELPLSNFLVWSWCLPHAIVCMFVPPKMPCTETLMPNVTICWDGAWEVIKAWWQSPRDGRQCPHKRDSRELPRPFHFLRIQWEVCIPEDGHHWTMLPPQPQTFQAPEPWKMKVCIYKLPSLRYLVIGTLLSQPKWT